MSSNWCNVIIDEPKPEDYVEIRTKFKHRDKNSRTHFEELNDPTVCGVSSSAIVKIESTSSKGKINDLSKLEKENFAPKESPNDVNQLKYPCTDEDLQPPESPTSSTFFLQLEFPTSLKILKPTIPPDDVFNEIVPLGGEVFPVKFIQLSFNASLEKVSEKDFNTFFRISPQVKGNWSGKGDTAVFLPENRFNQATKYEVSVLKGFSVDYGEDGRLSLDDTFTFHFITCSLNVVKSFPSRSKTTDFLRCGSVPFYVLEFNQFVDANEVAKSIVFNPLLPRPSREQDEEFDVYENAIGSMIVEHPERFLEEQLRGVNFALFSEYRRVLSNVDISRTLCVVPEKPLANNGKYELLLKENSFGHVEGKDVSNSDRILLTRMKVARKMEFLSHRCTTKYLNAGERSTTTTVHKHSFVVQMDFTNALAENFLESCRIRIEPPAIIECDVRLSRSSRRRIVVTGLVADPGVPGKVETYSVFLEEKKKEKMKDGWGQEMQLEKKKCVFSVRGQKRVFAKDLTSGVKNEIMVFPFSSSSSDAFKFPVHVLSGGSRVKDLHLIVFRVSPEEHFAGSKWGCLHTRDTEKLGGRFDPIKVINCGIPIYDDPIEIVSSSCRRFSSFDEALIPLDMYVKEKGHFVVYVEPDNISQAYLYRSKKIFAWLQITGIAVELISAPNNQIVVCCSELQTGKPIPGAEITLMETSKKEKEGGLDFEQKNLPVQGTMSRMWSTIVGVFSNQKEEEGEQEKEELNKIVLKTDENGLATIRFDPDEELLKEWNRVDNVVIAKTEDGDCCFVDQVRILPQPFQRHEIVTFDSRSTFDGTLSIYNVEDSVSVQGYVKNFPEGSLNWIVVKESSGACKELMGTCTVSEGGFFVEVNLSKEVIQPGSRYSLHFRSPKVPVLHHKHQFFVSTTTQVNTDEDRLLGVKIVSACNRGQIVVGRESCVVIKSKVLRGKYPEVDKKVGISILSGEIINYYSSPHEPSTTPMKVKEVAGKYRTNREGIVDFVVRVAEFNHPSSVFSVKHPRKISVVVSTSRTEKSNTVEFLVHPADCFPEFCGSLNKFYISSNSIRFSVRVRNSEDGHLYKNSVKGILRIHPVSTSSNSKPVFSQDVSIDEKCEFAVAVKDVLNEVSNGGEFIARLTVFDEFGNSNSCESCSFMIMNDVLQAGNPLNGSLRDRSVYREEALVIVPELQSYAVETSEVVRIAVVSPVDIGSSTSSSSSVVAVFAFADSVLKHRSVSPFKGKSNQATIIDLSLKQLLADANISQHTHVVDVKVMVCGSCVLEQLCKGGEEEVEFSSITRHCFGVGDCSIELKRRKDEFDCFVLVQNEIEKFESITMNDEVFKVENNDVNLRFVPKSRNELLDGCEIGLVVTRTENEKSFKFARQKEFQLDFTSPTYEYERRSIRNYSLPEEENLSSSEKKFSQGLSKRPTVGPIKEPVFMECRKKIKEWKPEEFVDFKFTLPEDSKNCSYSVSWIVRNGDEHLDVLSRSVQFLAMETERKTMKVDVVGQPDIVNVGDTFQFSCCIKNETTEPREAEIVPLCSCEILDISTLSPKKLVIGSLSSSIVDFSVKCNRSGRSNISIRVVHRKRKGGGDERMEEVGFDLRVLIPSTQKLQIFDGIISSPERKKILEMIDNEEEKEEQEKEVVVSRQEIVVPECLYGSFELSFSSLVRMRLSVPFLYLQTRYLGIDNGRNLESATSYALAAISLLDVLDDLSLSVSGVPKSSVVKERVLEIVKFLAREQRENGEFNSDVFLNVRVCHFVARVMGEREFVSLNKEFAGMRKKCMVYLRGIEETLASNLHTKKSVNVKVSIISYALYVRAIFIISEELMSSEGNVKAIARKKLQVLSTADRLIRENEDRMSLEARAWVCYAVYQCSKALPSSQSSKYTEFLKTGIRTIQSCSSGGRAVVRQEINGQSCLWYNILIGSGERIHLRSSNTRAACVVLEMFIEVDPNSGKAIIDEIVNGLLMIQTWGSEGWWKESSQDSAYAIIALDRYFKEYYKFSSGLNFDFEAGVWLQGDLKSHYLGEFHRNSKIEFDLRDLRDVKKLVIRKTGKNDCFYQLRMNYIPKEMKCSERFGRLGEKRCAFLEKTYFKCDKNEPLKKIDEKTWVGVDVGDVMIVRVRLTTTCRFHNLMIIDSIPGCSKILNPESPSIRSRQWKEEQVALKSNWVSQKWIDRVCCRGEGIQLFVDSLRKGVFEFSYSLKVHVRGSFVIPESCVMDLYSERIFGSLDADLIIVGSK